MLDMELMVWDMLSLNSTTGSPVHPICSRTNKTQCLQRHQQIYAPSFIDNTSTLELERWYSG